MFQLMQRAPLPKGTASLKLCILPVACKFSCSPESCRTSLIARSFCVRLTLLTTKKSRVSFLRPRYTFVCLVSVIRFVMLQHMTYEIATGLAAVSSTGSIRHSLIFVHGGALQRQASRVKLIRCNLLNSGAVNQTYRAHEQTISAALSLCCVSLLLGGQTADDR